ncbi:TetR/AcrR family transcriptional regulator [Ralstonia syzygii]|uniref:Putative transcription regulator protein,TetR-like, DNA-binding, bacterial/archaeal n=1 Tax=Ralstonia syzygii R24 TaxID=907261 RepID=G3A7G2_9RALS|nr:TetR/AcrR family transcriptional regulator [Ralstonia syzygii]CCA86434.1 putative transcription regulator protein,TetR-like, DNA-binding, bacterial/archaeal [Ralstonia syzygii R24]
MDNAARSERSRKIILDAALAILARDGPGKLTIDAIAQEGGISKGRMMHQFPTKMAVIEALLEQQIERVRQFQKDYFAGEGSDNPEAQLFEQIATYREAASHPQSFVLAVLGAMAETPELMSPVLADTAKAVKRIKQEAEDVDLALLRWQAARGIVLGKLLGMCPLSQAERNRLFERLLDTNAWPTSTTQAKVHPKRKARVESA